MSSYAIAVVLGTILMCSLANASEQYLIGNDGEEARRVTKVEAIRAKILDPGLGVVKCVPQELTEKATLRNVKKKK